MYRFRLHDLNEDQDQGDRGALNRLCLYMVMNEHTALWMLTCIYSSFLALYSSREFPRDELHSHTDCHLLGEMAVLFTHHLH
jgi:hypothetical protein